MTSFPIYILKAHDTDPPAKYADRTIHASRCIHCQGKFTLKTKIRYTMLSSGKIIWWHDSHIINDYEEETITF